MSSEIQDVIYGVGSQVLFFDCPEGAPTSVTSVAVYENSDGDDATAEVATTGSASVETSPNTTFDTVSGASQANPKLCRLADTQLLDIGRRYLARTQAATGRGATEWVVLAENNEGTGTVATSKHPLHLDYQVGDTFKSTRIQISVLDAWAADEDNISGAHAGANSRYRVRWEYVVNSVTYVADAYFDLVRYAGRHGVTSLDVERYFPGFLDKLPSDERSTIAAGMIDEAYKLVKIDLAAAGKVDQLARNREVMDEMVKRATVFLWAQTRALRGVGELSEYEIAEKQYYTRLDQLIRVTTKIPFSTDSSGAGVKVEGSPIWQR